MINDLDIVQWEYLLSPEFELINSAGKPLTGGWIEVYLHGTRDKYYCASDFDGTLHPFKIPLDSIGANVVLADPNNAYDVYVYNKFGSLIMSRYNVKCQGSGGSSTYVGDKLYYGQYRASNVTTIANLRRNKGNINITNDGYLKLKSGMSYHITVRGSFTVDDPANEDTTLNYIEYTSVNPIKIDIDETKEGPQYFELSYDIYRLQEDMDYQVAFAQSNGMVTNLIVEVHSLSNLATSAVGGDQEYEAGWGIDITNNVVSVDPSILEDYEYTAGDYISIDENNVISVTGINPGDFATHDEVYEATVTAIELVTGLIPEAQVQSDWDETDNEDPAYIKNKPDLDIYATHDEVSAVSSVLETEIREVSGSIVHYQPGEGIDITDDTISLSDPLYIEAGSGINFTASGDNTIVINADPIDLSDYATHDEVNTVSGELVNVVCAVSSVLQDEIDNIPPQVQSDWAQSDDTQVDYIKNKPTETELVAGQNIGLFAEGTTLTICASATDLSDYATHDEVNNVSGKIIETVNNVSGVLHEEVMEVSGSIIHYQGASGINVEGDTISLEEPLYIEAGSGINFTSEGDTITINADPIDLSDYATHDEVNTVSGQIIETVNNVSGDIIETVNNVSGQIIETVNNVSGQIIETVNNVSGQIIETVNNVSGQIIETVNNVSGVLHEETMEVSGSIIHYQGASGINVEGDTISLEEPLYIEAGSGINFTSEGDTITINADPVDLSDYVTHVELEDAISAVTGMIPEAQVQSDWTEADDTDPAYIKNKPGEYDLVAGQNIAIDVSGNNIVISSYASGSGAIYTAGDNIEINNDEISLSDVVTINARSQTASGYLSLGNVTHWGEQDYGPGWIIDGHTDNNKDYHVYNSSDQGRQDFYWNGYYEDRTTGIVSAKSFLAIEEGDIYYKAGDLQATTTLPIVWSCSQMSQDIEDLKHGSALVTGLPTTEPGKFTIQNNVSGGPIEVICPTDVPNQSSGITVDLNRYYLSNDTVITKPASGFQALVYIDPVTKQQEVYLPYASPYPLDSNAYFYYRETGGGIGYDLPWGEHNYIMIKEDFDNNVCLWGRCTYLDNTNHIVKFESYNPVTNKNEVWTWTNYTDSTSTMSTEIINPDYTAGDHIDITNNEISVTGITELVPGDGITITTSGASAIINSVAQDDNIFWALYGTTTYDDVKAAHTAGKKIVMYDSDGNVVGLTQHDGTGGATERFYFCWVQKVWQAGGPTLKYAYICKRDGWYRSYTDIQADWNVTNNYYPGYIKNKPTIPNYTGASGIDITNDTISLDNPIGLVAGNNITIEVSGVSAIISSTGGGGGGSSYTAGAGIDITNNEISVDNTVALKTDVTAAVSGKSDMFTVLTYDVSTWSDFQTALNGNSIVLAKWTIGNSTDYFVLSNIANNTATFTNLRKMNHSASAQSDLTTAITLNSNSSWDSLGEEYTAVSVKGGNGINQSYYNNELTLSINATEIATAVSGLLPGGVTPVQSNWNETDTSSLAYIQNKPTIPAAQVQANWNETDTSSLAYIQNKPTIPAAQVQANWNETSSSSMAYIKNKPNMSNYVTTTTHNDDVKYTFERYDSAGLGINAITAAAGVGKAKLRFQPGNLLTSYNLLSWSYCENRCYWGTNRSVVEFELGISMNNVIGTQWSEHNNVITLGNGNFIHQIYSLNGDAWTPTTVILKTYNNGTWVTSLTGILRDVRNSSTADNNVYLINVHGFIQLTSY